MALVWDKALFDEMYITKPIQVGMRYKPAVGKTFPMFNYHWYGRQSASNFMAGSVAKIPGFASIQDISVLGGAFGWTVDYLNSLGKNAISVDTSPYVVDNENVSEEAELRDTLTAFGYDPDNVGDQLSIWSPNTETIPLTTAELWSMWLRSDGKRATIPVEVEDMETNGSRRNVKQRLGNKIDVILSEIVLDSQENDNDALVFIERCEQLRPNPSTTVVHMCDLGTENYPGLIQRSPEDWNTFLDNNGFADHRVITTTGVMI